jgi:hypothetical protein
VASLTPSIWLASLMLIKSGCFILVLSSGIKNQFGAGINIQKSIENCNYLNKNCTRPEKGGCSVSLPVKPVRLRQAQIRF